MEAESKIRGFHHSNNNGFVQFHHPSSVMAMTNGSVGSNGAAGRQYLPRPTAGPTPPQIHGNIMGQQLVAGGGGRRPCYGVNNDENARGLHSPASSMIGGRPHPNNQRHQHTTLLQYQRQLQGSSFMVAGASSSYSAGTDGNRLPLRDHPSSSVVRHDSGGGGGCSQPPPQPSFLPVMVDGSRRRKQHRPNDNDDEAPSRPATGRYPVPAGAFVNYQCSPASASALLPPLPKYRSTVFDATEKARVHRPPRQPQQQPQPRQQQGRIPSSTAMTTMLTDFGRILGENPPPLPASLLNQLHQMAAESANNNGKVEPAGGLGKAKVMVRLVRPRGRHLASTSSSNHEQHLRVDQRRRQILLRDPTAMSMTTTNVGNARHQQQPGGTAPSPADGDEENDYADLDAVRDRIGLVAAAPKMFAFDAVFTDDDGDDKGDVAASSLSDVLAAVIRGNDGCVVSFGHPGLGKTEMMTASPNNNNNNTRREGSTGAKAVNNKSNNGSTSLGVIPSAIAWLYAAIAEQRKKTGARFSVRMSAVEIVSTISSGSDGCCNNGNGNGEDGSGEQMRDLLAPFASEAEGSPGMFLSSSSGMASAASLARASHLFGGQQSEIRASTAEQAGYLLDAALASRMSDNIGPRQRQSSSHLLVTLHLYQYAVVPAAVAPGVVGGQQQPKGRPTVSGGRSRLHLLDLSNSPPTSSHQHRASSAASASAGATAVTPSTIGNVLVSIFNGAKHLAQKESKVIQLLRECVGSLTCQAAVIASVSSAPEDYRHTLTVTQLAARIHRMRRRKIRMGGSSLAHLGAAHQSRLLARLASSTDPSSSEQSCDTVIYLGPSGGGDDVTDGEHPPNRIIDQHRIPSLGVTRVPAAVNIAASNNISQQQQHHVLHHQQRNRGDGHDGVSSFSETPSTTAFVSKEMTAIQHSQLASGPAAGWVPSSSQGQARHTRTSSTGQFWPSHQQSYPQPVARPQDVGQPYRPPTNTTAMAGATDGRRQLVGLGFDPTSLHQPHWGQVSAVPANRPRQHQAPIDHVLENVEKKHHQQWEHEKTAVLLNQQREKRSSSNKQSKGNVGQQGYGFMDAQKMSMIAQWVQVQTNQLVTTPSSTCGAAGDGLAAGGGRTAPSINNDDNLTEKTDDLFEEVEEEAQITTEEEESAAETADGDDEDDGEESLHEEQQQKNWSNNVGCENQVIQKPRTKDVAAHFAPGSDDGEIPTFSRDGKDTTISDNVQAQQKTPAAMENRRFSVVSYVEMADSVVQVTEEDIALAMALLNDVVTAAPAATAINDDQKQPALITREEACSASSLFNTSDHAASSSADEVHQHDAATPSLSDDQQDSVKEERQRRGSTTAAAAAEAKFRAAYCSDYDDLLTVDDDDDYEERESGVGSDHPLRVLSQENMTVVSTLASDRWSLSSCDTRFNEDGDEIEDEGEDVDGDGNVGGLLDVDDCWIPGANHVGNNAGRLLLDEAEQQDRDWRRQSTDSDPVLPYFGSLDVQQQMLLGPDLEVQDFSEEIRNYERRHQHRLRMVDELIQGGLPVSFEDLRKPDGASNPNLSSSSPTAQHEAEGGTREYFLPNEKQHASTNEAAAGTSVEIMMQRVSRFDSCARKEDGQNPYHQQVRIVENDHLLLVEKNSTGVAAFCKSGGERREATEGGCGDGTKRENEEYGQKNPGEAVAMRVTSNEEIVTCHWSSSGYASSASCSPLSSRESSDEAEQQHRAGRLMTNVPKNDRSKPVSVPEKEEACSDDEVSTPAAVQLRRDADVVVPTSSPPSIRMTRMERMSLREQPTNKNRASGAAGGMRGAGFLLNRSSSFKKAATRCWLSSPATSIASVDPAVDIGKHQQVEHSIPSPASSNENKTCEMTIIGLATKLQNKGCNTSGMEDDLRRNVSQVQQCSRINEQQPNGKLISEKEELIVGNKHGKNKRGSSAPPPSSSSHHRHWLNFWPFMSRSPGGGHQHHHHHAANPPSSLLSLDGNQQPFAASSAVEKNGNNNKHVTAV